MLKEIYNCQYITCMNPTAGSFSINPRLQVLQLCIYTISEMHLFVIDEFRDLAIGKHLH